MNAFNIIRNIITFTLFFVILQNSSVKGAVRVKKLKSGNSTDNPFYDDDNGVLLYTDGGKNTVNVLIPRTKKLYSITLPLETSFIYPVNGSQYQFVISQKRELTFLNWNYTAGTYYSTCLLATVDDCCPNNTISGGFPDGNGNILLGTKGPLDPKTATPPPKNSSNVYVVNTTTTGKALVSAKLTKIDNFRAVVFAQNNAMGYYTDGLDAVVQFDYDMNTGNISNLQRVFNFTENNITCGTPFGLAVDSNNFVYIAGYGCGQVFMFDPDTNKLKLNITIPQANYVFNLAFGGKLEKRLFITTAIRGSNPGKNAGSVFVASGLNATGYRDNFAIVNSDCTPVYTPTP